MKIVTAILDGRAQVRLAATRAPDLLRRQIATETGQATLIAVALAPPGLGPETLIARLDRRFASARVAPGIYTVAPGAVGRALDEVRLGVRLRSLIAGFRGRIRRRLRRFAVGVRSAATLKPREPRTT